MAEALAVCGASVTLLDPRSRRIVFATGHGGTGVLHCPKTADVASRFLLDGHADSALPIAGPDRFGDGTGSSVS